MNYQPTIHLSGDTAKMLADPEFCAALEQLIHFAIKAGKQKETRVIQGMSTQVRVHGVSCEKMPHLPNAGGYLHGEDDDTPYDVDGCKYCGRCHRAI